MGATTARLQKVRELAAFLRELPPQEIEVAVHYLAGELPQGRIGTGYPLLRAASAAATTVGSAAGSAAKSAAKSATDATATNQPPLSISEVDQHLEAIAAMHGSGSAARRLTALTALFTRAAAAERDFLSRLLLGELRQGALLGVMLDGVAAAAQLPVAQVRRAAMYSKSLGCVARVALVHGGAALDQFQLQLFSPVSPMLAQTAADVAEALRELGGRGPLARCPVAFEWKMDGARIQLHKAGAEVRIYTRSLNEVSDSLPEIIEVARTFAEHTLVLDGEAIAFDAADRPHPFQITMRRFGRKLNVQDVRGELPIRAFFFDCLFFGGRSIADEPASVRSEALGRAVPRAHQVPRLVTDSLPAASAFYDAALAAGHEGLMAKALDAAYEAGNRGAGWLKIKRAHTLDLVVLGAEWGHGRRTGLLSNLHLGALEPATGQYVMLGKTFKGLTDTLLKWQTRELLAREIQRDQQTVYVRPELVVEIAFSDLQASRRYPGGLALRLARVKRYRDDKRAEEADTMAAVRRIFRAQGGPQHASA